MEEIKNLVQDLLKKKKERLQRVYQDEPLLFTANQMERGVPARIREMRAIARSHSQYYQTDARLFYLQAKYMEDFEDTFDYHGEFSHYYPSYQAMNDLQLRGYFSFRTKLRRGIVEKSALSFVFVYLYELLHLVGVSSPEEGFHALYRFWQSYRVFTQQIDHYVRLWLQDFVVYYGLPPTLLAKVTDVRHDRQMRILFRCREHSPKEVFEALNQKSSYQLSHSKFYQQEPEDVELLVYRVFCAATDYYQNHRKNGLCQKFFGREQVDVHVMFQSAVFYHQKIHEDTVYQVNDFFRMVCTGGQWHSERLFWQTGKNKEIGALLKSIDQQMRQRYRFKYPLKELPLSKTFRQILSKELDLLMAEKQADKEEQQRKEAVKIDVEKLDRIREAALRTQEKLIVAEEETDPDWMPKGPGSEQTALPATSSATSSVASSAASRVTGAFPDFSRADPASLTSKLPGQQNVSAASSQGEAVLPLEEPEGWLLSCLLYEKPYEAALREKGRLLSVMVDAINEGLFEQFGDRVIEEDEGGQPRLIPDYIDELKGMIPK